MLMRRRAGMLNAWQVLGSAVSDVRDVGVFLLLYNILWFFCCVLVITAPPATAALYAITREQGYRNRVEWLDFFRLMRRYFWISWRWGLMNLIVVVTFIANLTFYAQFDPPVTILVRGFWTSLFILWLIVQMYCFPVLLEQESPRLRLALRNSFVLVIRHPIYTLTFALVTAAFLAIGWAVPYFFAFFIMALLLYFHNRGVWYIVRLEKGEEPEV